MSTRKPPPERRPWARIVNREWRLTLADGKVLDPERAVTQAEARDLARGMPTFLIGYLHPTEQLAARSAELAEQLALVLDPPEYELFTNSATVFRARTGEQALVLQYRH